MIGVPAGTAVDHQFAALCAAFAQARHARPDAYCEAFYTFAGRLVRLRVVGRALAERVSVPFAHLRAPERSPSHVALTVDLWDEVDANTPVPAGVHEISEGGKWIVDGGVLSSSTGGRFNSFWRGHSLMWLDRDSMQIVGCIAGAGNLTLYERSKPLPILLTQWYRDHGVQVMHAGLVAKDGRGALIAGPNGSGKSTLTLACLCDGFESLGDDHIGLEVADGETFVGHSLYNTTRLEPHQLRLFPQLAPGAIRDHHEPNEKELIVLAKVLPERLRCSIATHVLVLPRRGGPPSATERASKAETLRRLAPSSLVMALGPGQRGLDTLARLVNRVPAYWLNWSDDLRQMAEQVKHLLANTT